MAADIGDAPGAACVRGIPLVVQLVVVQASAAWPAATGPPRSARAATTRPARVAVAAIRTPWSAPVTNAAATVWNRAAPWVPPIWWAMAAAAPTDCRATAVAPGPATC